MRRPLWDNLRHRSSCDMPWCVIGYFNVIASVEEQIGGIPYQMKKSIEFLSMVDECGLVDLGFNGQRYTWSNRRGPCSIVWKRLDRGFVNDNWLASYPATTITHLAVAGSDHLPLLMEVNVRQEANQKYFKFLKCWVDNDTFLPLVQRTWEKEIDGHPMWIFHQKLKATSKKVKEAEEKWLAPNDPTDIATLHEIQAQYVRHLKVEEAVLKQKTQLQRKVIQTQDTFTVS
ncbi:uncharacterized protein [Nicotiana sylvestris]|uniref:uncharacterized protein n=1 Tax=Nicotiana sylvestris TaxID=4096 RepID=UPI00388C8CDE